MMGGKAKKVFPGNNTSEGFYSFYENIIRPDANRIFIIKGGPGVGKSTFMKKIGAALLEKGYDAEFHCCSSDNGSLDAVVIPKLQAALIDGTAPHIVDPKNPGAVDEIVHLGDYWDEEALVRHKEDIIAYNKKIARLFQTAYSYLREARVAAVELRGYFSEALLPVRLNRTIHNLCAEIFADAAPDFQKTAGHRRLFASANTPDGLVHYLETILAEVRKLYILKGEAAAGRDELFAALLAEALRLGLDTEAYHCPFEPEKLELLYFPSLLTGILYQNERLDFDSGALPDLESLELIDLDQHLSALVCAEYSEEIEAAKDRLHANIERAYQKINRAKKNHDEMEKLYVTAMDFSAVEKKREEILARLLKLDKRC